MRESDAEYWSRVRMAVNTKRISVVNMSKEEKMRSPGYRAIQEQIDMEEKINSIKQQISTLPDEAQVQLVKELSDQWASEQLKSAWIPGEDAVMEMLSGPGKGKKLKIQEQGKSGLQI